MTLVFVVIGLTCNFQGCYWAKDRDTVYESQEACASAAAALQSKSAWAFKMDCMIEKEPGHDAR